MVGRAGRDGEPSQTLLLASPSDATALRRFAVSDVPTHLRARVGLSRAAGCGRARRPRRARCRSSPSGMRASSSACSSRQASSDAASTKDGSCGSSSRRRPTTRASESTRCSTGLDSSPSRAPTASSPSRRRASAGTSRSRRTSARSSRGPCGACDVCAPLDPRDRFDLEPSSTVARGRRRGDRRRGRLAHVAARAPEPDRDAARIAEGASVGAPILGVPTAGRRDRCRRATLGATPRSSREPSSR